MPYRQSLSMHRVFLIPGFFGFANLGDLTYFAHVREVLDGVFAARHEAAEFHFVNTLPTASLPKRAAAVAAAILASDSGDDPVHLIGHSTGGLDARLLCSPGATLPGIDDVEALARRVRTVVTVATPHYGAPQASLFSSLLGQSLLRILSIATLHGVRLGTVPIPAVIALAGALPRMRSRKGPLLGILDQVYHQVLRDFDAERREQLKDFFSQASADQSLLAQLSVESMTVFNAATSNRPTANYGCVVTQGRPPSIRSNLSIGISPTGQALYSLYRALYDLASAMPADALPSLGRGQSEQLVDFFGTAPSATSNDAIVSTLSQIWGDLIFAAWADHHDVIGHFSGPDHHPPHVDWLTTRSGFTRTAFEELWQRIADYLLSGGAIAGS